MEISQRNRAGGSRGNGDGSIPAAPAPRSPMEQDSPRDSWTEIHTGLLERLILKHLLFAGRQHIETLARALALAVEPVEAMLKTLYAQGLLDRQESCPSGYPALLFPGLSDRGRTLAQRYAIENAYRGPMPVSLEEYGRMMALQGLRDAPGQIERLCEALRPAAGAGSAQAAAQSVLELGHCVLVQHWVRSRNRDLLDHLDGRLGGAIAIPFAVEVDGEIVKVFDPARHLPAEASGEGRARRNPLRSQLPGWDHRWAWCRRPLLSIDIRYTSRVLEPVYEPDTDSFDAPLQLKANGGVLLVDATWGSVAQKRDLLRHWVRASEQHRERIALGGKSGPEFPFDALVVFLNGDPEVTAYGIAPGQAAPGFRADRRPGGQG